MQTESILKLLDNRKSVHDVVGGLCTKEGLEASRRAGEQLIEDARVYGLGVKDYLIAAINPEGKIGGYELAKAYLHLPTRDDHKSGVALEAASNTFNTFPGVRAMFPEVIDDMLQWANRQLTFENIEPLLAGSRTTGGNELLYSIINDDSAARKSYDVAELANIPMRAIQMTSQSVKFYKVGSGIKTSYEFQRRARLDVLTPFLARVARELEVDKVRHATQMIINGDGASNNAAAVVNQSVVNATIVGNAVTAGQLNSVAMMKWLTDRANAGTPVDTVLMNFGGFFEWNRLFSVSKAGGATAASDAAKGGIQLDQFGNHGLNMIVRPVISSSVPNGQIVGITKGETVEELKEANSKIEESQNNIRNQSIEVFRTENVGYRLIYGDAREVFDYTA